MADTKFSCRNCGEAPAFEGCDDCLECTAAYMVLEDPDALTSSRRIFAGTPWLAKLNAACERVAAATMPAGRQVAA